MSRSKLHFEESLGRREGVAAGSPRHWVEFGVGHLQIVRDIGVSLYVRCCMG
jgi:hypothetical protein